jgi:hypothetical protein
MNNEKAPKHTGISDRKPHPKLCLAKHGFPACSPAEDWASGTASGMSKQLGQAVLMKLADSTDRCRASS